MVLLLGTIPLTPRKGILSFHVEDAWTAGALADFTRELAVLYVGLSKIDFFLWLTDALRAASKTDDVARDELSGEARFGLDLLEGVERGSIGDAEDLRRWVNGHGFYGDWEELRVHRIAISSPGVLDFIGHWNPIKLIFDFILAYRQQNTERMGRLHTTEMESLSKSLEAWQLMYDRISSIPQRQQPAARQRLLKMLEELIAEQFGRLEYLAKYHAVNRIGVTQTGELPKQE